ncbi:MAG: fimbrillin family protein [Prevotella sp.]|jgi:hypothetical protein|nr:fimbrillin family protein [Prevotella sp.]
MIQKRRNFVFRFLPGLFLSGLLLLSGCSQDDVSDVPAGSRAIDFRAQGGMSSLKATTTGADYIRSFAVNAHYGTYDDQGKFLMEGVTVYRGEGGGNSWTYSPQAYFPTTNEAEVNFFAYSPSGSKYVEKSLKDAATASDEFQKITYEVPAPALDGASTSQEDLLVARQTVAYNSGNSAYPGTVQLKFHHALSRILVAASSNLDREVSVVITKLELKNLYSKGKLSLSSLEIPVAEGWGHTNNVAGSKVLWTNYTESTLASYKYSLPASGVHVGEVAANVTGDDQGIFVLPQKTAGDNVTDASLGDEFGLEIDYTINGIPAPAPAFKQFSDLVSSTSKASVTFEIGRQYVLNLTFGAGSGTGGGTDPDINIGAKISFEELYVDPYPDDIQVYPPQPPVSYPLDPVIWSQSNIYYDNTLDGDANDEVGALTFSEETAYKYQGVYFKWGSLVGVSTGANDSDFSKDDYLFIPDSDGQYYKVKVEALAAHTSPSDDVIGLFKASLPLTSTVWTNVGTDDSDALTALWAAIPCATSADVTPVPADNATGRTDRDDNALTTATGTTLAYSSYKGDICKYLVDKKSTNGNSFNEDTWRMPTSNDFGYNYGNSGPITNSNDDTSNDNESNPAPVPYRTFWNSSGINNGGSFTASTNPENGTDVLNGKAYYTLFNWVFGATAKPDFPASGYRYFDLGNQKVVDNHGVYWSSSSASGASNAYSLGFNRSNVHPAYGFERAFGLSVRCVRDGENAAP